MPCLSHGKPQRETTVGPHSHPLSHLSRLSVPPTVHTTPSTPRREKMRRSHARGSPRTDLKQLAFGEWLLWGSGAGSIFDGTLLRKKASEHMEPPTLCPPPPAREVVVPVPVPLPLPVPGGSASSASRNLASSLAASCQTILCSRPKQPTQLTQLTQLSPCCCCRRRHHHHHEGAKTG